MENNISQVDDVTAPGAGAPPSVTTIEGISIRDFDDFITFEKTGVVNYIDAEDSNFYPVFYVPNVKAFLIEARCKCSGTSAASGTVTVEKLPSGTARGLGQSMLASPFSLANNPNVTKLKAVTTVLAAAQVNPGDAVGLRPGGSLTGARDVEVTCLFGVNYKNIPIGPSATVVLSGV